MILYLKGICTMRNVPAFKIFEQIVWVFSFLSRKLKFYPFSWKSSHEHPWLLPVCFPHTYQILKPEAFIEYHCSEEPWETSGGDIPSDCPTWRLPAAKEGQWKGKTIPALQLLQLSAETTDEGGSGLMCQVGIWSGRGTRVSHIASLVMGSCCCMGQGSICHLKQFENQQPHASQQLWIGKIFQTSPFELLIGKWQLLTAFDISSCSLSAL